MKSRISTWAAGVAGAIIAGIVVYFVTVGPPPPPSPPPGFILPKNGIPVPHMCLTKGRLENPLGSRLLRFCVREKTGTTYGWWHPQDNTTILSGGGLYWQAVVPVGPAQCPTNHTQQYEISAIAADKENSDLFDEYLAEAKKTGTWRGLERLPSDAEKNILARVIVTRE